MFQRLVLGAGVAGAAYGFGKQRYNTYSQLLHGGMTRDKFKAATIQNATGVKDAAVSLSSTPVGIASAAVNVARSGDRYASAVNEAIGVVPGGEILADVIEVVPSLKKQKDGLIDYAKQKGHEHVASAPQAHRALQHNLTDAELHMLMTKFE